MRQPMMPPAKDEFKVDMADLIVIVGMSNIYNYYIMHSSVRNLISLISVINSTSSDLIK
jgi:hypothetical protein